MGALAYLEVEEVHVKFCGVIFGGGNRRPIHHRHKHCMIIHRHVNMATKLHRKRVEITKLCCLCNYQHSKRTTQGHENCLVTCML